jgi:hypothetical protein
MQAASPIRSASPTHIERPINPRSQSSSERARASDESLRGVRLTYTKTTSGCEIDVDLMLDVERSADNRIILLDDHLLLVRAEDLFFDSLGPRFLGLFTVQVAAR